MMMRQYVTRSHHIISHDKQHPAGTECLAGRLPDGRVILTFDEESTILGDRWFLEGLEPRPPALHAQELFAMEDARFLAFVGSIFDPKDQT